MALSSNIQVFTSVPLAGTNGQETFVTLSTEPRKTTRLNTLSDLSNPQYLVISHQTQGNEKSGFVDRHLIQLTRTERTEGGVASVLVVNTTISVPRNGLFNPAEVKKLYHTGTNLLLGDGVIEQILTNQH